MNIFIYSKRGESTINKKEVFILTRPFLFNNQWIDDNFQKKEWGLGSEFRLVDSIQKANLVLLANPINSFFNNNVENELEQLNSICIDFGIKAFGIISGDFGTTFPEYSNIIYFRQGGFKSQLSDKNRGFIVGLSDHYEGFYNQKDIVPNEKKERPSVGFCGHASASLGKRIKELLVIGNENLKRFLQTPMRFDYEPFFASAYERTKLLSYFENNSYVKTNFIYRKQYRGGAQTAIERKKTTLEYYENIRTSDYVLCVRGAGNFSVRFYETLMMGRIPIFINTDCLLPFEDHINWKKHVVWIEWKDRRNVAQKVSDFHSALSNEEFKTIQINNRKLWKETLSIQGIYKMIANDI